MCVQASRRRLPNARYLRSSAPFLEWASHNGRTQAPAGPRASSARDNPMQVHNQFGAPVIGPRQCPVTLRAFPGLQFLQRI